MNNYTLAEELVSGIESVALTRPDPYAYIKKYFVSYIELSMMESPELVQKVQNRIDHVTGQISKS